ncbi:hypothetical protein M951_chr1113 (nucleomorph) [Lotharella oceanica]|uniref:Uncharacterized protein n=1 Tax=Lotharella oceanica TaxID=641309 RepID=A0A060DGD5_9EUKA|nr:hypothetical protein M951_chr1113 [Lotharella oceanica]
MYSYNFIQTIILHFLDYDFFNDNILKKIILFTHKIDSYYTIKIDLGISILYKNNVLIRFILNKPIFFLFFVKIIILKKIRKFINAFFIKKKLINKKFNITFILPDHLNKTISYLNHQIGKLIKCNGSVVKKEKTNIFVEQNIFLNEYLYLVYENSNTGILNSPNYSKLYHKLDNHINNIDLGFSKFKNSNLLKIINNYFSKFSYSINLFVKKYFYNHIIPGDFIDFIGIFFIFFLKHTNEFNLNVSVCMISTSCSLRNKKTHKTKFLFSELLFNAYMYRVLNIHVILEQNYLVSKYFPITFKKIIFFTLIDNNKRNLFNTKKFKNLSFLFIYNKNFLKKQLSNIFNYLCNDCAMLGNFSWNTLFSYGIKLQIQIKKKLLFNLISLTSKKIIIIDELNSFDNDSIFFIYELIEHQILNLNNLGNFIKIFLYSNFVVFLNSYNRYKHLNYNSFNNRNHLFYANKCDLIITSNKINETTEKFKISTYLQFKQLQLELNIFDLNDTFSFKIIRKRKNNSIFTLTSIKKLSIYINKIKKKYYYSKKSISLLKILFIKLRLLLTCHKKYFTKFLISKFSDLLINLSILNSQIRMSSEILIFDIIQSIYLLQLFQFNYTFLQF